MRLNIGSVELEGSERRVRSFGWPFSIMCITPMILKKFQNNNCLLAFCASIRSIDHNCEFI